MQERDKEPLQERFFRPHFLQAPGDMVAHEGRLCRLDCKVDSNTHPDSRICSHFAFVYSRLYLFYVLFRERGAGERRQITSFLTKLLQGI